MRTPVKRRLQTPTARRKLAVREQPYFAEVRRGLAIGYRRGEQGGSWILREFRDGRYVKRRLGTSDDDLPADGQTVLSWQDCLTQALGAERATVSQPGRYSVADAAEAYFEHRAKQSDASRDLQTYEAFIEPKFGMKSVGDLTTAELRRWHSSHVLTTDDREARRRSQATANRRWTVLRAILNFAYQNEPSSVPSADAWLRVKPYKNVERPRQRFLSSGEARRLLNVLPADVRALARGSLYTGCRLGELLTMKAAQFTDDRIHVLLSKSGKSRTIPLSNDGISFFAQEAGGKAGDDSLFPRADGGTWSRVAVSRAMKAGCQAAKIVPHATFHDLRRSYGSLLLNSGAPAEVIQELLGHADLRMTRRTYAHLLDATVAKAVQKHLPSFGIEKSNVRTINRT